MGCDLEGGVVHGSAGSQADQVAGHSGCGGQPAPVGRAAGLEGGREASAWIRPCAHSPTRDP